MNLTISYPTIKNTWKRIKAQRIIAAAVVGLVISALIASSPWKSPSAQPVSPASPVAPAASAGQRVEQSQSVLFLVDSAAGAAQLEALLATELNALGQIPNFLVLTLDSNEAQSSAFAIITAAQGEALEFGTFQVEVVDLRGR